MNSSATLGGLFASIFAVAVGGCQTTQSAQKPNPDKYFEVRYEMAPHQPDTWKSQAGGIVLETAYVSETPGDYTITLPKCDKKKGLVLDDDETVQVLPPKTKLFKATFVNDSSHVARLPLTVMTLRDPVGNLNFSLTQKNIEKSFVLARGCPLSNEESNRFKTLDLISRDTILVPKHSTSGHFAFPVIDENLHGVWTLAVHEVPVKFDITGMTTKTDHLEQRYLLSKFADLHVKLPDETEYVTTTKDLTDGGSAEQALEYYVMTRQDEKAAAAQAELDKAEAEAERLAAEAKRLAAEAERLAAEAEAERLARDKEAPANSDPVSRFFKSIFSSDKANAAEAK